MFSYTSLIKEIDNFNSDSFMKSEIADVWKRKNLRNNEAKDIPISIGIEIESDKFLLIIILFRL
jgi:hypothetical protein